MKKGIREANRNAHAPVVTQQSLANLSGSFCRSEVFGGAMGHHAQPGSGIRSCAMLIFVKWFRAGEIAASCGVVQLGAASCIKPHATQPVMFESCVTLPTCQSIQRILITT